METYEHRQFSPWPIAVAGAAALFGRRARRRGRGRLPAVGLTLFLAQFSMLTTIVDDERVAWAFGLGFPGGAIDLNEIAEAELTTTSWWEGFGIHWTPRHGWLWNAAGKNGVRIRKRNGGSITLGSDDAQGLYDALQRRLKG